MRVRLLGRFSVTQPGQDLTPKGKAGRLLKVVAANGRSLHDEKAIEALWPSVKAEAGRERLRNALYQLRRRCGPVLAREGGMLVIPPDVSIDAEEFDAVARRALESTGDEALRLARQAVDQYRGDLLPEEGYAQWALEPRDRLRRRFRALLEVLVHDARARRDLDGALLLLERALAEEPDDEALALDIVEVLNELGRRAAALRLLARVQDMAAASGLAVSARWEALSRETRNQAPRR